MRGGGDLRDPGDGDGDLGQLSRDELMERAKGEGIQGRSKMSKKELVEALGGRD